MSSLASAATTSPPISMQSLAVAGADPFKLSETLEEQEKVFRALFAEQDSYKSKGSVAKRKGQSKRNESNRNQRTKKNEEEKTRKTN